MRAKWISAGLVGLGSGFIAGLLGIGGGIVKMPGLVLVVGIGQYLAAGISTVTNVFSAAAGAVSFGVRGSIDFRTAALVFVGASVGAYFGAKYLEKVPEWFLTSTLSVVMLVAAARMWF
jgi:uncharacterized membrane protein YfcA